MRRLAAGALVLAASTAAPLLASPKAESAASQDAAPDETVTWPERHPPFQTWEYVGTGALLAGAFALRFGIDTGTEPNWRGGFGLDEAAFSHGFLTDTAAHDGLSIAGDAGYWGSIAYSAAEPLVVGLVHDWYLAGQITLMNLEGFAVYSAMLFTSQLIVRRERPATRLCDDPALVADLGFSCSGNNTIRSFVGGHVGTAATATTLTCLHHANLPLYGGGLGDAAPCAFWLGATGVVFASRQLNGKHWLSDNLLGVGIGALAGLVPYFLHYGIDLPATPKDTTAGPFRLTGAAVAPTPRGGGATLQLGGLLE